MPTNETAAPEKLGMFAAYGDSGLKGSGGFITEEYLPELAGARGRRVYAMMANDATIAALLFALRALTMNVEWTVQAADDTDPAEKAKEWLEGVIEDMRTPLADVISEACTMYTFGFAPMEVTYKVRRGWKGTPRSKFDDGKIGIEKMELRAQTSLMSWDIDARDGTVLGMNQLGTWKGAVTIPRNKLALFRCDAVKGNPESTSLLRGCYRSWFLKSKLEEIEAIGAERNNAGLPVIRIPNRFLAPGASAEERAYAQAWADIGKRIRRDQQEYLLIASDGFPGSSSDAGKPMIDIQLLTPNGKSYDTGSIVRRHDESIARSLLMQFIFLGSTSAGSFALSDNQTDLFATALGAFTKRIAQVFNTDVIDVLWDANGFAPETRPKLVAGDLEKPDMVKLMGMLQVMAASGATVFPDRELENHLRKQSGLPMLPEDNKGEGADLPDQGMPKAG